MLPPKGTMKKPIDVVVFVDNAEKLITVTRLPIIKYVELLKLLKELPKHLKNADKFTSADFLEQLPNLLAVALPEVLAILSVAINEKLTVAQLETLGVDEITSLSLAVFEANNYTEVFNKIKKVTAQTSQPVAIQS
jgi:hypothetical protein